MFCLTRVKVQRDVQEESLQGPLKSDRVAGTRTMVKYAMQ